jgi:nucleotide-binding universal stress UspA family protein
VVTALDLFPEAVFTLLHAYRVPFAGFLSIEANAPEMLENEQHQESDFIHRLEAHTGRIGAFTRLVEYGDLDSLIVDFVQTHQPDCMVVGAHDHRGAPGWLVPDVAGRLLMIVDCDVLVVPELIGAITTSGVLQNQSDKRV